MIITVTLNPAIDKTAIVQERVKAGGLNRLAHTLLDAGGKGINVSKTIHELGGESIAIGFLGKIGSERILECLEKDKIKQDFILVEGATRTNLKIVDLNRELTEFNEAGPIIEAAQIEQLIEKLEYYASPETIFVFSGNVPIGVPDDIYKHMIQAVKRKGAKAFLDADGNLFKNGIQECPSLIKPNERETAEFFGLGEHPTEEQLIISGKRFLNIGVERVIISRGDQGALLFEQGRTVKCEAMGVPVDSAVGAGDAMVAGMVYAREQNLSFDESIRLAMACSAGAVMTAGTNPPSIEVVRELQQQVSWHEI